MDSTLERSARSSMRRIALRRIALFKHAQYIGSRGITDIGVATWQRSWIVSLDLKHTEASFAPSSIDSLCLPVAQVAI
jgi:hypothetical protein